MDDFLKTVISSIAELILVVDEEGSITYASPQAQKILGIKAEELIGKKLWKIPNLEDFERMEEFFIKLKLSGFLKRREIFVVFKEKERIHLQVYATPLKDFSGFVLAIRDITPLIEAHKKIEDLNEVLRLMNKMLRHDLLNKLAVLKGFLEISIEDPNRGNLERALKFVDDAVELINRMREFETTLIRSELRIVNVREVVEKVAENFRKRGVEVNIVGEASVMADEALYSVFDNIFNNAVKHGEAKRIDVMIESSSDHYKITVEDYGKGLPPEITNNLFKEGFTYGNKSGSGLGLYIVKKVLERYGGEIRAYNRKGAVFEMKIKKAMCQ